MPVSSRFTTPLPNISLPTYLFTSPTAPLPDTPPIYLNAENPDRDHLSLSAYRLFAQRLASGLRAHGLQPGDRVMLFSSNSIFFPVVIMGVIMSGGVFTGANPSYSPRELAHQLGDADCHFMLTGVANKETALAAAEAVGMDKANVFAFDPTGVLDGAEPVHTEGLKHWTSLLTTPEDGRSFVWADFTTESQCNETAALNYSSGTTGLSKGVQISHRNFISNACSLVDLEAQDPDQANKLKGMKMLACLPMFHAMGQCTFVTMAPKRMVPSYIMSKFDFPAFLKHVETFKITELILVPPIMVLLAKRPEVRKTDLSSVNLIASGAAPLSKEICTEVEALFPPGKIAIKQAWGMTECTSGVTGFHPLERPTPSSVGELMANCEAKVMAEDNVTECPRGEAGELWVRGPNITTGYWRNEEATRNTITEEGWLRTGDVGYVNEEGKWFIVDRIKELIKAKGHQVAPAELEGLLLDHPAVADAAVIGVTLADETEHPRAYIVPKHPTTAPRNNSTSSSGDSDSDILLQDILKATNARLAPYKHITGGIVAVDVIPKSPSGKLVRKQLRELAAREMGRERERAKL